MAAGSHIHGAPYAGPTEQLSELVGRATPALLPVWSTERELWSPRLFEARGADGTLLGAALTAARPLSAYRKVVAVSAADVDVWRSLVAAALEHSGSAEGERPAALVTHFEEHVTRAPLTGEQRQVLAELGFEQQQEPWASVPSTLPGHEQHTRAYSYWHAAAPGSIPRYYGQTTEVTCGAVASLTAQGQLQLPTFAEELTGNRRVEIGFWRRATNLPACEPVGLAVETAKELRADGALPEVYLSSPGPVLIDEFAQDEADRLLREDLQAASREEAREMGIPVREEWVSAEEIARRVREGEQALLLIDLTELIADPTPHWVLASSVVGGERGEEALLISDPWVHYPNGETWVDTFALPLPLSTIERVTRWGSPAYRGVIFLPGAAQAR